MPLSKRALDDLLRKCCEKHNRIRRLVRTQLEEEIQRAYHGLKISAEPITERALQHVDATWAPAGRREPFDWRRIDRVGMKSHPRRLDLALWDGQQLCGLMMSRLSDRKEWLSITHLEGAPVAHSLKGQLAPVAVVAADIYAALIHEEDELGRQPDVRILNPLPQSMAVYERCGYSKLHVANGYRFAVFQEKSHDHA